MGALGRVKRDHNHNMLIPSNVAGEGYEEGASPKQAIAGGAVVLLWIVVIVAFKDKPNASEFKNWLIVIGALLLVSQFVIRYLIINEKYLMKQTALIDKMFNKVPADLWNVINIDDDGIIYYTDGRLGLIIAAEQATVIGRDSQFKEIHYSAISDFYKVLNQNNIAWTHINAMINAKTETRLLKLSEQLKQCQNSNIRKMCDQHFVYLRSLEERTLYEREYWALIARPAVGRRKLLEIANMAAENLESAAFNQFTFLGKEQCYALNTELLALDTFDANNIMIEKAQQMAGAPLATLTQVKLHTNEFTNAQLNVINNTLKMANDGSTFVGTQDGVSTFKIGKVYGKSILMRLQSSIQTSREFNDGDMLSVALQIKFIENQNNQSNKLNVKQVVDNTPMNNVQLFGIESAPINSVEDLKQDIKAQKKEADLVNKELLSEAERQQLEKERQRKMTIADRQKKMQEEAARRKAEAEKLAQEKAAQVNFDEFKED